ncbi:rhodanese-like domain-containing protein [Gracilibacillus salinarum]|uniref:Rhodanese-like domain-containing protein n=1 Tax=Gracilibacillus salinarum TaxID=2932255 RepID=A0ABY4GQ25_9BACI|nr:rhodanese-like domain-containing protein [Gracilibacillus salinarum]UOQ86379.1 rhodanese-like domain-containing protein [Gracilibacillus salinarum]
MNEIQPNQLAEKLKEGEKLHIVDVREDEEVAQGMIPGAKQIRLGEIPDRLDEFDQNQHYYMICRSGARSGRATEYLEANGIKATNMTGGMLAWEDEVE